MSIAGPLHSDPAAFSYEAQKLGKDELLGNSLAGPASSSGPGAYVGHFTAATRLSLGSLGEVSRAFAAFTYTEGQDTKNETRAGKRVPTDCAAGDP